MTNKSTIYDDFNPSADGTKKLGKSGAAYESIEVNKISNLTDNGFVKTGSSDGTLSVDNNTYIQPSEWLQNGFVDKSNSTISFTNATRTFSIQPTVTSFDYYVQGIKYTSTGDTVVIGGGTYC